MTSWIVDCPELEIQHTPLKGHHCALNPGIETSIDLLEIHSFCVQSLEDPGVVYKRNLGHEALVEHLDPVRGSPGPLEAAVTHLVRIAMPNA
ncbi:hypothetical protein EST38_g2198 [Candolleomyces aberdarensis]|uniref:Uncharacterized protein n=1 Tax=Candolleomyces aberdarensis TaxID=2316362 RepID=A0A4Q2DV90_9AGAR|nr:hypothetical protein EST38_g2198 [Candolleomyces aberdarensis]